MINNKSFKLEPAVKVKKLYVLREVKESRDTKREETQQIVTEECSEGLTCDAIFAVIMTTFLS